MCACIYNLKVTCHYSDRFLQPVQMEGIAQTHQISTHMGGCVYTRTLVFTNAHHAALSAACPDGRRCSQSLIRYPRGAAVHRTQPGCVHVLLCVCVCVCVCVCAEVQMCVCVCTFVCVQKCKCVYAYVRLLVCVSVCECVCDCVFACVCVLFAL